MPSVNSLSLTLTTVGDNVTITITYNAVFTAFERQLAGLGMAFGSREDVIGIDPPNSLTGTQITSFPQLTFPVTVGSGALSLPQNRSMTVPRATLQEDPTLGDSDEIRVRIRIRSVGLPPDLTPDLFTDQEILLG